MRRKYSTAHPLAERGGSFLLSSCLHVLLLLALTFAPKPETLQMNLDLPTLNLRRVTIGSGPPPTETEGAPEGLETPGVSPLPTEEVTEAVTAVPEFQSLLVTESAEPELFPPSEAEPPAEETLEPAPLPAAGLAEPLPTFPPLPHVAAVEPALFPPLPEPGQETQGLPEALETTDTPIPQILPEPEPVLRAPPVLSDEDMLLAALDDAERRATPLPRERGPQTRPPAGPEASAPLPDERALTEALAAAGQNAQTAPLGGGGGDGIGYYGIYVDSVISRIRPHFTIPPRSDNREFELIARLEIAEDGSIVRVQVLRTSGNSVFDANVLRAIREAGKMEPPLSREVYELNLVFNSRALLAK
ncbi:MAG: TonB C-terminal domain-containing protein [Desulfovibrionaceae bacterium]|nr:TonB C-terminal domain-containing protein [Desulfovibrionaceae bacterium]